MKLCGPNEVLSWKSVEHCGFRNADCGMMWTRRNFLRKSFGVSLGILFVTSSLWNFVSNAWARTKKILPKGFSKEELKNMNPEEIDNKNLEIDPLDKFGTMGPTDLVICPKTYRLKVTGKVVRPLSLSYDQILKYPSLTETVLLICPGFFSNNGHWTGVHFKALLQEAQVKKEAHYIDINGDQGKGVRIPLN